MIKSISVFDFFLQPYDQFIFYPRGEDEIFTLVTDIKYPYPNYVSSIWDEDTKTFVYRGVSAAQAPDKIVVPTHGVREKDLTPFLLHQSQKIMENALNIYENTSFSIFIPRRKLEEDLIQIGMFAKVGTGELHNAMVEAHLERLLKLKVFW